MSAEEIVKQIDLIRQNIGKGWAGYSLSTGGVRDEFHSDVNYLLSLYGEFLGTAKIRIRYVAK